MRKNVIEIANKNDKEKRQYIKYIVNILYIVYIVKNSYIVIRNIQKSLLTYLTENAFKAGLATTLKFKLKIDARSSVLTPMEVTFVNVLWVIKLKLIN